MAQVGKQVVASQFFLNGLLSLPHFPELRLKQLERLLALISKSSLTLEQSGPIISSLDSRIWDGVSLERLKSALADKTVAPGDAAEIEGRVKQQDYSSLPRYLTEEWWLLLEKADSQALKEKALEKAWNDEWDRVRFEAHEHLAEVEKGQEVLLMLLPSLQSRLGLREVVWIERALAILGSTVEILRLHGISQDFAAA